MEKIALKLSKLFYGKQIKAFSFPQFDTIYSKLKMFRQQWFLFSDICGSKQRKGHFSVQCNRCHVDSGPIQPNSKSCYLHLGSSLVLTFHHYNHFNKLHLYDHAYNPYNRIH